MTEPVVAIVVAAGSGRRLGDSAVGGSGIKALRLLRGRPLVAWSVEAMRAGGADRVVVVIAPGWEDEFRAALADAGPVTFVEGGAERQDSVRHGLAAIAEDDAVVLVHDAARPLVPAAVTARVIDAVAAGARAVIPVIPVTDSVRAIGGGGSRVVDRAQLRAVQTPQGFDIATLRAAHHAAAGAAFTDDAAVCEAYGASVELVEGSVRSMKITHATDFAAAGALLEEQP